MKDIVKSFKEQIDESKEKFSYEDYRQVSNKLVEVSLASDRMDEQQRVIKENLGQIKSIINKYVKND